MVFSVGHCASLAQQTKDGRSHGDLNHWLLSAEAAFTLNGATCSDWFCSSDWRIPYLDVWGGTRWPTFTPNVDPLRQNGHLSRFADSIPANLDQQKHCKQFVSA